MSSFGTKVKSENCVGCGRCVVAASQLTNENPESMSLATSPIMVERSSEDGDGLFSVYIDEAAREYISPLAEVCPHGCFRLGENDV